MRLDKRSLLLYAVTDRAWTAEKSLTQQVEEAITGGATIVQLREKSLDHDDFLKLAFEIKNLCSRYDVPFIINDDVDIALKCDADGVHVGQSDMAAYDVRKKIGDDMILGVSVINEEQAAEAEKSGADYLGTGAMFITSTKEDADLVSFDELKRICQAVSIPVVAIGGIQKHNIEELNGSGICGAALVSAIFSANDIENECREIRSLCEKVIKEVRHV